MPEILTTVIVSLVSSGALVWLFKLWFEERLKKAIEFEYAQKLKALEHGYDKQLENLRAQLQSNSLKAKEELDHDRKIFERLTTYCNETTFRDTCGTIMGSGFFEKEQYQKIETLERNGNQDENHFANPELRAAFKKFHACLDEFTTILARYFFRTSGNRYCLYPELKEAGSDEKRKAYEDARIETMGAGAKVLEAFSEFRKTVKERLLV